jgi:predicted transcriptional regulator
MRERLLELMTADRSVFTAARLAIELDVGLSSLSSLLNRLVKEGKLKRADGVGPRGGYGYYVPRPRSTRSV